jgi:hypothetical protein
MASLLYDLRFAFRGLTRRPGFVAVAVFSLALGIAVNVAVFSVLGAILLPPLGVPDPSRLVFIGNPTLTYAEHMALREALAPYGDVFASLPDGAFPVGDEGRRKPVETVSDHYFAALGLRASAGRLFTHGDDVLLEGQRSIVLSHALWKRVFGGDPAIVGQTIPLGPKTARILGVGPPRFRGVSPVFSADIWTVASRTDATRPGAPASWTVIVRLHPDVSAEEGRTAVEMAVGRLPGIASEARGGVRVLTMPHLSRLVWAIVSLVMLIPGIVLLVACANVSGLFASRAEERCAGRRWRSGWRWAEVGAGSCANSSSKAACFPWPP